MTRRKESVEEVVRQELAGIIAKFFPSSYVITLTDVKISDDFRLADVWVSVYTEGKGEEVVKQLNLDKIEIQSVLNKRLIMKYAPKIKFRLDNTGAKVDRIEALLKKSK